MAYVWRTVCNVASRLAGTYELKKQLQMEDVFKAMEESDPILREPVETTTPCLPSGQREKPRTNREFLESIHAAGIARIAEKHGPDFISGRNTEQDAAATPPKNNAEDQAADADDQASVAEEQESIKTNRKPIEDILVHAVEDVAEGKGAESVSGQNTGQKIAEKTTGNITEKRENPQSSQRLAEDVTEESERLQTNQEFVAKIQAATRERVAEKNNSEPVSGQNTKQDTATNPTSKLAQAKCQALRREKKQILKTEKRIAQHRRRRNRRRASCAPIPKIATQLPYLRPLPSPLASPNLAHDKSFYENQTFEESRKYVQERLTAILGPERMQVQLLPSGHNPIDPVIAEYNQQVATNSILDQWEAQKIEWGRQAEEQQRRAAEEETERQRILILLDHYREKYVNRLEKLALFGPDLTKGVNFLEAALLAGDLDEAGNIIVEATYSLLLPIHELLNECEREIPLEEVGAEKLSQVWPVERLEAMCIYLRDEFSMWPDIIDIVQGIEAICMAIRNPTPFQDPFAPKQVPVDEFHLNVACNVDDSNLNMPCNGADLATNTLPSEGLQMPTIDLSSLGSGFSKLLMEASQAARSEEQRDPAPSGSGFAKLLAATAEKFQGDQTAAPNAAPDAAAPDAAASTPRAEILQYINDDNMEFQSHVQDLIRRNAVVASYRRKATEHLKGLICLADGQRGFLRGTNAGHYRCEIEACLTKLETLPNSERRNKDTKALKLLCEEALRLWAAYH